MSKKIKLVALLGAFIVIVKIVFMAEYSKRFLAGEENTTPVRATLFIRVCDMAILTTQVMFGVLLFKAMIQTIKTRKEILKNF